MATKITPAIRAKFRKAAKANTDVIMVVEYIKGWLVFRKGGGKTYKVKKTKQEAIKYATEKMGDFSKIIIRQKDGTYKQATS